MEVVLASGNAHKIKEIKDILFPLGIEVTTLSENGYEGFDIEETGSTFSENSKIKAKAVHDLLGKAALADDSGLCVDALDGDPGVFSARYAGMDKDDDENNKKLLAELSQKKGASRKAHYECVLTLITAEGKEIAVSGKCYGTIGQCEVGDNGFGYDPLFIPDGYDRTFAQLSPDEKNAISHRKKALEALKQELEDSIFCV